jgi:hypothetical protein
MMLTTFIHPCKIVPAHRNQPTVPSRSRMDKDLAEFINTVKQSGLYDDDAKFLDYMA